MKSGLESDSPAWGDRLHLWVEPSPFLEETDPDRPTVLSKSTSFSFLEFKGRPQKS